MSIRELRKLGIGLNPPQENSTATNNLIMTEVNTETIPVSATAPKAFGINHFTLDIISATSEGLTLCIKATES